MPKCDHQAPLCSCIDWKKDDITLQINHLMQNFEFSGFYLEYNTLESEKNRRLCKVGRCHVCGQRLCYGMELLEQDTGDALLAKIYHWVFCVWDHSREQLPDGVNCFRDMFLSLFREPDQDFVCEWLNHRAGQPNMEGK